MRRFFLLITSHPLVTLCLTGAVALAFGACLVRLERDPNPDAFIPPDHPALALKKQIDEEFDLREPIAVAVVRDKPGGVFTPDAIRLIADLTKAIQKLPQVQPDDVISLATESGVYFDDGEPGFERLMKKVPDTPEACQTLRQDVLGYELYRGTLVAADGSAACIIVRTPGTQDDDRLYRDLAALVAGTPTRDERLFVAGEAAVRAHMGSAVSDDALRMNLVCPVAMALLIVLAYRTLRGAVLPLCVIGGASAVALGSMAACRIPVYIVTNGIFVIIMALGVDNSFHLIGQYYEEQLHPRGRSKQQIIVDACMALWFPMTITSFTDLAGFMGLYVGGMMPPIRYFGVFACVGVLGALVYCCTLIPAGLMLRPLKASRVMTAVETPAGIQLKLDVVGRFMAWLGEHVFRRRALVLGGFAALLVVGCWGASKLTINDARIMAFKDDHPLVQATNAINARFDGTGQLNVVVRSSQAGAMLQPDVLRRIADLETFTESLPYVGGTHSLAGWVKRAHQKMHDEDPAFYAIPDNPDDTRFYLDTLSGSTSPMAHLLKEVVDKTYTNTNLTIRMRNSEYIHQRQVIHALQDYLNTHFGDGLLKAQIAGRANLDYHWLSLIAPTHLRSIIPSLVWVLVLTGLMFRSVVAGLLCTLTAAVAVVVNYAVMGLGGIPLSVGSSMFASIAIGAGVNFPVHMLERYRHAFRDPSARPLDVFREASVFTGRPLCFTALVIGVGFLLLCVSRFRTLVEFGLLIGTAMVVTFVASVTLLPALVAVTRPRFVYGGPRRRPGRRSEAPPASVDEPRASAHAAPLQ